ncbi:DUF4276 family protein [Delftia acidovorans]|uniref:DUF4276 family protein n=1 Tax=Delftia acidovorans TaxID=80866 RepID=UPI00301B4158
MFAILAEDDSDFKTLKEIIWRICNDRSVSIKGRGFGSGSELLNDGARDLEALIEMPKTKSVIVCHDADALVDDGKKLEINQKIIRKVAGGEVKAVPIVPVSMIESWILADINACCKVFKSLRPLKEIGTPEGVRQPKKEIERLCGLNTNIEYSNVTHNKLIAQYIDLKTVYRRCRSFRPLAEAVDKIYYGEFRKKEYWEA